MLRVKEQSSTRNRNLPGRWLLLACATVGIAVVASAGCGSGQTSARLPVFPAKGKVSLPGRTLKGATIVLHPVGAPTKGPDGHVIRPHGVVRDDGTFDLTSYETNDGAPSGEYKVTLELRKAIKYPNGDSGPGPNLVPEQYTKQTTSPLFIQVAANSNELPPIVLKNLPSPKQKDLKSDKQVALGPAAVGIVRGE